MISIRTPLLHFRQCFSLICVFAAAHSLAAATIEVEPRYLHLGNDRVTDWEGVNPEPEGDRIEATFQLDSVPARGGCVKIRQRNTDNIWRLRINDTEVAELRRLAGEHELYYDIPASALRPGANKLEILPDVATDDVAIGEIVFHDEPRADVLKLGTVSVKVSDSESGSAVPARLSLVSTTGELVEVFGAGEPEAAVRKGIVYTRGDGLRFQVPQGRYELAATRGMEWSRASEAIEVTHNETTFIALALTHEVDIPGFVAVDTHLHTLTISGHGDASLEERMLTLAGEGVELAVATDHNHNVDYRPYQTRLELNEFFTPVVGNEVTSDNGHFNAFPLDPNDEPPNHKETDWVKLVAGIREKGAKVVILNHPRWPAINNSPFSIFGLNRATGDRARGPEFTFDAMELMNSTTLTEDPDYLLNDWFALLNRGEKITAVGSSDSHTVGDPPGQGRTYVMSSTDVPSEIDVDEICENFLAGRTSVSLGIFADIRVDVTNRLGQTAMASPDRQVSVALQVKSPGWIKPTKAVLYVNGTAIEEQPVPSETGRPTDTTLLFNFKAPPYDIHVVCTVVGEPVTHPGWATLADYTFAATNPVYLDVDRDRVWMSPRDTAQRSLDSMEGEYGWIKSMIQNNGDPVIAVQLVSLARPHLKPEEWEMVIGAITAATDEHELYQRFLRHVAASEPAP